VQLLMEPHKGAEGQPALPQRRGPGLAGLAAFTLDQVGQVVSWPATAASLFGCRGDAVIGQHVCDVLMTGPGHRAVVDRGLAQVAAGDVWTTTVAGGRLGEGRFALRWEAIEGAGGAALVIVQRAWPQPAPGWLTAATARIGGSLDLSQTACEVAEAAVTEFADAAAIYAAERLLVADGRPSTLVGQRVPVRRLAVRMSGQAETVTGSALPPGEVLFLAAKTPRAQAMATGRPVLSDVLDGEAAEPATSRSNGSSTVDGYVSFLAMPLIARGITVGCAVFCRTVGSPAFNQGDVALAAEFGSRAAVAIDNARLYDQERRTALALQRGLLPASMPSVPAGIEVAHRYLPVGDSVVGGDWHDIVPLPGERAALIVGDAMGHGPEAAAVMVQLRTAAHTLADLDLPPEQVLRRLDVMAAGMDAGLSSTTAPFATCVYAVIDPAAGTAEIARAGHLPPMLASPGGRARLLDLPPGLPLGLGEGSFEAVRFKLPPGATLALYTDGLVESRSRTVDDGVAALKKVLTAALADSAGTIDEACVATIEALREHGEDDITLMLARLR
jgi:serine phosphatase RsbU (regulator of sigma subunit)